MFSICTYIYKSRLIYDPIISYQMLVRDINILSLFKCMQINDVIYEKINNDDSGHIIAHTASAISAYITVIVLA